MDFSKTRSGQAVLRIADEWGIQPSSVAEAAKLVYSRHVRAIASGSRQGPYPAFYDRSVLEPAAAAVFSRDRVLRSYYGASSQADVERFWRGETREIITIEDGQPMRYWQSGGAFSAEKYAKDFVESEHPRVAKGSSEGGQFGGGGSQAEGQQRDLAETSTGNFPTSDQVEKALPAQIIRAVNSSRIFWRLHNDNPNARGKRDLFNAESAYSQPIGGETSARRGYSTLADGEEFAEYWVNRGTPDASTPVVLFTGEVVGAGTDGEPLVVPNGDVLLWTDFGTAYFSANPEKSIQEDLDFADLTKEDVREIVDEGVDHPDYDSLSMMSPWSIKALTDSQNPDIRYAAE